MGIFDRLFGSKKEAKKTAEDQAVFYAKLDEKMSAACAEAQQTFCYFWRELYWEYRRIVPAHDLAIVKIPFKQKMEGIDEPVVEHMWINTIDFDGEKIQGILMNSPNQLTNVSNGDKVSVAPNEISDWLLAINGETFGGYTIQLLRSNMTTKERKDHDKAWGLKFGDYNNIQVVYEQTEHPENLIEHPMSINMATKTKEYLKENPEAISAIDESGKTMLHREAIAGNKTTVLILLEIGADKNIICSKGKKAIDYAKDLNWQHLLPILND